MLPRARSGFLRWAPLWCLVALGAAALCLGRGGPHGRWAGVALWIATGAWLGLLASAFTYLFRRCAGAAELLADRRVIGALATCCVLFAAGITWGWPGTGWPPDELDPGVTLAAWHQRFTGGWHDKYPPVFYYLLSLANAPVLTADYFNRAGTTAAPLDIMFFSGRVLSLMFSMGAVAAVGLLTTRLGYRREAWLAVLLGGTFLPMAFYAKTANVDAAYLFWFVVSLVLFAGVGSSPRTGTFIGIGTAAALAIATKDQAYALYVLPGLYILLRCVRGSETAIRPRHLIATVASGLIVWMVALNVIGNPEGVRAHLQTIVGPASTAYRVFEPTLAGQIDLMAATGRQVFQCLSWAGVVCLLLWAAAPSRRPIPLWLWLTIPSSYISFTAIVGYSYDRFLLPLTLVCAVPAALGLSRLLHDTAAFHWKRIAGLVLLGWIVLRPVGLDVLMLTDARYAAEQWLSQTVQRHETVGAFGQLMTLPRLERFNRAIVRPGIEETLRSPADYIVINTEHMRRFANHPTHMAWLAWLQSGAGPYREVFRYKAPVPWYSPLRLDSRFTDRVEDPFTNLDKANPEIAIFRRQ